MPDLKKKEKKKKKTVSPQTCKAPKSYEIWLGKSSKKKKTSCKQVENTMNGLRAAYAASNN